MVPAAVVPAAVALPNWSVPPLTASVPVKLLLPESVNVPLLVFVRPLGAVPSLSTPVKVVLRLSAAPMLRE